MRMIRSTMLAGATILAAAPATAQRFDASHPVCLQRWERAGGTVIDCSYTSWAQCQGTASGLSATCLDNPYWSQAHPASANRRYRR
jgi:hypothetical protein